MTVIRIAVHALLRGGAIALLVVAYDFLYDQVVTPTSGDADIGKGLLAFTLIAGVCFTWGLVDGLRLPPLVWAVSWTVAGLVLALGWELVIADGSLADVESGSVAFIGGLLTVPAIFGAGLAWATGGPRREAHPAH